MTMTTIATAPARAANVRLDYAPTFIAGALIRIVPADAVPAALRDHAHGVVPEGSVGEWWTVGQFRPAGRRDFAWLVAKRRPDGVIAYGMDA